MNDDWREHLAKHVSDRRTRLRRPLGLGAWGGPSDVVVARIERAEGPVPRDSTLRKLDAGLDWVPGSAQRVVEGGVPLAMEPPDTEPLVGPEEDATYFREGVDSEGRRLLIGRRQWTDSTGQVNLIELRYWEPTPVDPIRTAYFMSAARAAQSAMDIDASPRETLPAPESEHSTPASAGGGEVVELPGRDESTLPPNWEELAARRPGRSAVDAQRAAQDEDAEGGDW